MTWHFCLCFYLFFISPNRTDKFIVNKAIDYVEEETGQRGKVEREEPRKRKIYKKTRSQKRREKNKKKNVFEKKFLEIWMCSTIFFSPCRTDIKSVLKSWCVRQSRLGLLDLIKSLQLEMTNTYFVFFLVGCFCISKSYYSSYYYC